MIPLIGTDFVRLFITTERKPRVGCYWLPWLGLRFGKEARPNKHATSSTTEQDMKDVARPARGAASVITETR